MWKKSTTFCLLLIIFFKNYHQRAKSIPHTKWSHNTVSFLRLVFVCSVGGSDQTVYCHRQTSHTQSCPLRGQCPHVRSSAQGPPRRLWGHPAQPSHPIIPPTGVGILTPGTPGISAVRNNYTFNHCWCSTLSKSKLSSRSICTASATAARQLLTRGDRNEGRFPDEWKGSTAKTVSRLLRLGFSRPDHTSIPLALSYAHTMPLSISLGLTKHNAQINASPTCFCKRYVVGWPWLDANTHQRCLITPLPSWTEEKTI